MQWVFPVAVTENIAMRVDFVFLGTLLVALCLGKQAKAVEPSADELATARQWVATKFEGVRAQNIWRRWMMAHSMPKPGGELPQPQCEDCNEERQRYAPQILPPEGFRCATPSAALPLRADLQVALSRRLASGIAHRNVP